MIHGAAYIPQGQNMADLINRLQETADSLPPPQKNEFIRDGRERCACGRLMPVDSFSMANTGAFLAPSNVCPGCKEGERLARECSSVYCSRCRRFILWIKPHKDKDGFEYLPGKAYHLSFCGICADVKEGTGLDCPIIEKVIYSRSLKKS